MKISAWKHIMGYLKIIHAGVQSRLQYPSREGLAFYGIPNSGFMDVEAAEIAKMALGLNNEAPLIECALTPPKIQFYGNTKIVLSGADMSFKINSVLAPMQKVIKIKEGDILSGHQANDGIYAYIGCLLEDHPDHSTKDLKSLFFQYHQLNKSDILNLSSEINRQIEVIYQNNDQARRLTILKGPEYEYLQPNSVELMVNGSFEITTQSNRMGARLQGHPLKLQNQLTDSVPVLPGFIQCLPDGQLLIVLNDGQTMGGYPRIGYLNSEDLQHFIRQPLGSMIKFDIK